MKKKIILTVILTICLALLATILLLSCDGKDKQPTPSTPGQNTEKPSDETPHSHEFGEWKIVKEASCTEMGIREHACDCGEKETLEIDALGHTEVTHEAKAPTCLEIGYDAYVTCSKCNYSTYAEKPALGHNAGADATCTDPQICTVCGDVINAALGHTEVSHEAKVPTCEEIGWDAYVTCSRCNYSTYAEKPALGHNAGADATCTDPQSCTVCGKALSSEKGHIPGAEATCTAAQACIVCGITINEPLGHAEVKYEAKDPTCTDVGWNEYVNCSRCEYTTYAEKSALGHIEVTHDAKTPTCTEIGWDAYVICSRCDHTTYAEKSALGHIEVTHDAKTPTCTEIGWDAYVTCSRCDHTTYAEKSALGHTNGAEATCTTAQTCTVCGETIVAALGHSEVPHDAKAPTCLDIGWDAYVSCLRCDYDTYVEKPALGHDYVRVWDICSHCGEIKASEGLEFTSNGDGTCYVSGIGECTSSQVVIPKYSDAGDKVIGIGYKAFREDPIAFRHNLSKVYIPETVEYIESYAFFGCQGLTSVILNEGLKEIGGSAFMWCGMSTIELPDSLVKIGAEAFYSSSIRNVTIPKNVETIGDSAFGYGIYLTSIEVDEENKYFSSLDGNLYNKDQTVLLQYAIAKTANVFTIPDGVVTIGNHAFYRAGNLIEVNVPDGVVNIEVGAFESSNIYNISLPDSVKKIGDTAFNYCFELRRISLGNGVETIGYSAFGNSGRLFGIEIPASVNFIDYYAFENCTSLEYIEVDEGNDRYYSVDGVLFDGYDNTLVAYPAGSTNETFVVPDGVVNIEYGAFSGCSYLVKVVLPEGLYQIGQLAFSSCDNLVSVNIPGSVSTVYPNAFYQCNNLTLYCDFEEMPEGWFEYWNDGSVKVVWMKRGSVGLEFTSNGDGTCYLSGIGTCTDEHIVVPATSPEGEPVVMIGEHAFWGADHTILSVTLPEGIEKISGMAFASSCEFVEKIVIPASVWDIGYEAFVGCSSLKEFVVSEENSYYTSIDGNLYDKYGNTLIKYAGGKTETSFRIPDDTRYISGDAFASCHYIETIIINPYMDYVNTDALSYCENLLNVEVAEGSEYFVSVDGILYSSDMSVLVYYPAGRSDTSFVVPEGVVLIEYGAFYRCDYIESVILPESLVKIGNYAFVACNNLKSIDIPDNVEEIGYSAFEGCDALSSVAFGENSKLRIIGNFAFLDCRALTSVIFGNTEGWTLGGVTELSSEALSNPATAAEYLKTYYNATWEKA